MFFGAPDCLAMVLLHLLPPKFANKWVLGSFPHYNKQYVGNPVGNQCGSTKVKVDLHRPARLQVVGLLDPRGSLANAPG